MSVFTVIKIFFKGNYFLWQGTKGFLWGGICVCVCVSQAWSLEDWHVCGIGHFSKTRG